MRRSLPGTGKEPEERKRAFASPFIAKWEWLIATSLVGRGKAWGCDDRKCGALRLSQNDERTLAAARACGNEGKSYCAGKDFPDAKCCDLATQQTRRGDPDRVTAPCAVSD